MAEAEGKGPVLQRVPKEGGAVAAAQPRHAQGRLGGQPRSSRRIARRLWERRLICTCAYTRPGAVCLPGTFLPVAMPRLLLFLAPFPMEVGFSGLCRGRASRSCAPACAGANFHQGVFGNALGSKRPRKKNPNPPRPSRIQPPMEVQAGGALKCKPGRACKKHHPDSRGAT